VARDDDNSIVEDVATAAILSIQQPAEDVDNLTHTNTKQSASNPSSGASSTNKRITTTKKMPTKRGVVVTLLTQ
jgi:hypothetical protein